MDTSLLEQCIALLARADFLSSEERTSYEQILPHLQDFQLEQLCLFLEPRLVQYEEEIVKQNASVKAMKRALEYEIQALERDIESEDTEGAAHDAALLLNDM